MSFKKILIYTLTKYWKSKIFNLIFKKNTLHLKINLINYMILQKFSKIKINKSKYLKLKKNKKIMLMIKIKDSQETCLLKFK